MQKINLIQFLPYFPPHKWWLETVAEEIWIYWEKNNLWKCINIITSFNQNNEIIENEKIVLNWEVIWYIKYWVENLVIPSFEIINNFPVYKIWSKKYKLIKKYLKEKISNNQKSFRIITHTRFFLTSLIWWKFARKNKIKWVHIEHWSDYVLLSSKLRTKIAYIYDRIIWKWIFKNVDNILAISDASKKFILKEFWEREINVFYRWLDIDFENIIEKSWEIKIVFIGRLVKLKWVELLVKAYKNTNLKIQLIIIWDWEEKKYLEELSKWKNIKFLWIKNKDFVIDFLSKSNCILVNPSYQEWLPSSVIEWLLTENIVLASNVWWTKEISDEKDLILFKKWDIVDLEEKINYSIENYNLLKGKSKEKVKEKFSWEKNILKLYSYIK